MRHLISLLLLVSVFVSCAKDDDVNVSVDLPPAPEVIGFDTILPLSYFPVYPGSYWDYEIHELNYVTNDGTHSLESTDTTYASSTTETSYVEYSYHSGFDVEYDELFTDTVLVPFYDGNPIYGYSHLKEVPPVTSPGYFKLFPFLKETVGDTFVSNYVDHRFTNVGPFYTVLSKTTNSQNDSILTLKKFYLEAFNPYHVEYLVYQKDVGLVSHYHYSFVYNDTIYRKELKSYFINK